MTAALNAALEKIDRRTLNVRAAVEDTDEISLAMLQSLCRIWRHRPDDLCMALHGAYILCNKSPLCSQGVWNEIEFLERFYGSYTS